MCLLDASKAFDCVHLAILFEKLCIRDIFVLVLLDLCVYTNYNHDRLIT